MSPALTCDEELVLPRLEAILAGTLALMTGYSQALQAALHPAQRLAMGRKIGGNLGLLAGHPALSENFQRIVLGLEARWALMSECTEASAPAAERCGSVALRAPSQLQ